MRFRRAHAFQCASGLCFTLLGACTDTQTPAVPGLDAGTHPGSGATASDASVGVRGALDAQTTAEGQAAADGHAALPARDAGSPSAGEPSDGATPELGGGARDSAAPSQNDASADGSPTVHGHDAAAPARDDGAVTVPVADAGAPDTGAPDAGAPDAGAPDTEPDAGEPVSCVARGDTCETGDCCADSVCVRDDGAARCVAPCRFPQPCTAECGPYCGAEPDSISLHCSAPILLAKDGTYLGRATSNKVLPESVCNPNGSYGNGFGTYSIHNKNGTYGNSFSPQSPYNTSNFDGPAIACPDEQVVIAFVNKAGSGFDDIDPDELCDWLARNNFF